MLADKTSEFITQIQPRSSTYQDYLDAKAEMIRRCYEHADLVRDCRRKQINAYLSQKLINELRAVSNHLNNVEKIPDDPKPSNNPVDQNFINRQYSQISNNCS